jgi:hypothetical protein
LARAASETEQSRGAAPFFPPHLCFLFTTLFPCSHLLCRGLTQAQALMSPVHGIFDGRLAHDVKVCASPSITIYNLYCFGFNRVCSMFRVEMKCCILNRVSGEGRRHHRAALRRPQRQGHRGGVKGSRCPDCRAAAMLSLTSRNAGQGCAACGWSQRLHR